MRYLIFHPASDAVQGHRLLLPDAPMTPVVYCGTATSKVHALAWCQIESMSKGRPMYYVSCGSGATVHTVLP